MKNLIFILLLLPVICNAQIATDKYYHAGVGAGLSVSTHLLLPGENVNPMKGTLITLPVASFKEFYDVNNGGRFSFQDIGASLVGSFVIDGAVLITKKIIKRNKHARKKGIKKKRNYVNG